MSDLRILIVDDDPDLCRVACWTLEGMATCEVAHDLESAARLLDASAFDLVLIDVTLRGESGLALLDQVQYRWPDTAATVISGRDDVDVAEEAIARGALAYLVKPFRVNDLRIHVATVCATHRRMHAADREPARAGIVARIESMLASHSRVETSLHTNVMCAVVEFRQMPIAGRAGTATTGELGARLQRSAELLGDLDFVGVLGPASFVLAGPCAADASATDAPDLVRMAIDATARMAPSPGGLAPGFVVGVSVRADDAGALLTEAEASARAALEQHLPALTYTSELEDAASDELELFSDLATAIAEGQIDVAYQPQYLATSLRVIGVEALARWHHETRGDVPPSLFVPVAERHGLIAALGEHVLREACRAATTLTSDPARGPRISVNVSVAQLRDPRFPEVVLGALRDAQLPSARLCLEVTESLVLEDSELLRGHFRCLAENGIRWSLDDFGTGFSTFESLAQFPWNELKVDSILTAQFERRAGREILRSVVAIAARLDLDVVAEGVESTRQFEALRNLGFGAMQGYLMCRPMPGERLRQELAQSPPRALRSPFATTI
jgi:EAL domain-containing protein (putative c-di-GMP-specific phosphodiesterase class I)/DNA-binding response OmpR family regulator